MERKMRYPFKELKKAYKPARNWWNTFILKPVMLPTLWFVANFTPFSPNAITTISLILYIICGYFFSQGNLLVGAIFFELGVIGDAIDGKLARLKGITNKFGAYYDTWVDTIGHFIAAITLGYGMYVVTSQPIWMLIGGVMFFMKIQHPIESLMVSNIMGKESYQEKVIGSKKRKDNKESKGMIFKIRKFLLKRKLRDPLSGSDMKNLMFFVAPLLALVKEFLIVLIPLYIIKTGFWFFYYKKMLKE